LVVTNRTRLAARVTEQVTTWLLRALQDQGVTVVDDIPEQFDAKAVRERITPHLERAMHKGVLILGGPDVVPAKRSNCLPDKLRRRIDATADPDQFIVWSDSPYGDIEGDSVQELPVSRLPDMGSPSFLAAALGRPVAAPGAGLHGIRNVNRPFADKMVEMERPLLTSEPVTVEKLQPADYAAPNLYFMLHGDDSDGSCFWGETDEDYPEAVRVPQLPGRIDGVVFAGCCWGALAVRESARRLAQNERPTPREASASLALTCLARGALAFVGCTGAHYSPPKPPYDYLSGPLHRSFWANFRSGKSPARSLFDARIEYLRALPHKRPDGIRDNMFIAMELKTFEQFTCLGRGF
jgi:hypothetical protein